MSVFENGPVYSSLPNLPPSTQISSEKKDITGFWYGFSAYPTEYGNILVFHKSGLSSRDSIEYVSPENIISRQYVTVRAFSGTREVGSASFCPYAVRDGGLQHPTIWCSAHTGVDRAWQRRGVASSIYAHVRDFGYKLSPAPVLSYEAQSMWQAFDASFSFDTRSNPHQIRYALPIQTPSIPDLRTEADRAIERYAPEHISFIRWVQSSLAKDSDSHAINTAKELAHDLFSNPTEALTSLIIDHNHFGEMGWIKFVLRGEHLGPKNSYRTPLLRLASPKLYQLYKCLNDDFHKNCEELRARHLHHSSELADKYSNDFKSWMGFSINTLKKNSTACRS